MVRTPLLSRLSLLAALTRILPTARPSLGPGIRVISDLDDTVKRTDLVGGLREVFRNVFCRDVTELEVDGMAALYRSLLPAVKGFHYVVRPRAFPLLSSRSSAPSLADASPDPTRQSNSPLELFEPIHSFLHANAFPEGFSLKLKFYGGRSLFHGLWEPAGERKARGVLEVRPSLASACPPVCATAD